MKTILIVDDEYALVETLTELLQHEGYRVVTASNGRDALDHIEAARPDLVLTDLMMPIADGRELIRTLREKPALDGMPIVLMSSSTKRVALTDDDGKPLTVAAFLRKPFPWKALRDVLESLVHAEPPPHETKK